MNISRNRSVAILQARMSSGRLSGKVMMEINNQPLIFWQINRIQKSHEIRSLIVATSSDPTDDVLAKYVESLGVFVHRGSLENVYSRFNTALENENVDFFLRLTGDCPLVMPNLIDSMILSFQESNVDYLSNCFPPTFPDGLDIEIVSKSAFKRLEKLNLTKREKEHVTLGLHSRPELFLIKNFINFQDLSSERWSVDYQQDFDFVRLIFEHFKGNETNFSMEDVIEFLDNNPKLRSLNSQFVRNESLHKGEFNE